MSSSIDLVVGQPEVIGQLVERATEGRTGPMTAWTAPDDDVVISVLDRLGFELILDWSDPVHGSLWLWERPA